MQWGQREKNKFPPFSLHINKETVGVLFSSFPAHAAPPGAKNSRKIENFCFSSHQIWWAVQTSFRQEASTIQTTSKNPKTPAVHPPLYSSLICSGSFNGGSLFTENKHTHFHLSPGPLLSTPTSCSTPPPLSDVSRSVLCCQVNTAANMLPWCTNLAFNGCGTVA